MTGAEMSQNRINRIPPTRMARKLWRLGRKGLGSRGWGRSHEPPSQLPAPPAPLPSLSPAMTQPRHDPATCPLLTPVHNPLVVAPAPQLVRLQVIPPARVGVGTRGG